MPRSIEEQWEKEGELSGMVFLGHEDARKNEVSRPLPRCRCQRVLNLKTENGFGDWEVVGLGL